MRRRTRCGSLAIASEWWDGSVAAVQGWALSMSHHAHIPFGNGQHVPKWCPPIWNVTRANLQKLGKVAFRRKAVYRSFFIATDRS